MNPFLSFVFAACASIIVVTSMQVERLKGKVEAFKRRQYNVRNLTGVGTEAPAESGRTSARLAQPMHWQFQCSDTQRAYTI